MRRQLTAFICLLSLPAVALAQPPQPVQPLPPPLPLPAPAPPAVIAPVPVPLPAFPHRSLEESEIRKIERGLIWAVPSFKLFRNDDQSVVSSSTSVKERTLSAPFEAGGRADAYSAALNLLQRREYERAISQFDAAITQKSPRSDAALYWKAFAQYKLAKTDEALATLGALRRDQPKSRYLGDAKILEADVRKLTGQNLDPATLADDEIKLLAIQALGKSTEAIPLLEGVLAAANALAVKKRAIFLLAISDDPRAQDILVRYAKGGTNPDLQSEAARFLYTRGSKVSTADLADIYRATDDLGVRRLLLSLLMHRNAPQVLRDLYEATSDPSHRQTILNALYREEDAAALVALARKETNMQIKTELVRRLAILAPKSKAAADYMVEILK